MSTGGATHALELESLWIDKVEVESPKAIASFLPLLTLEGKGDRPDASFRQMF
ncbi:hypothetical protein H6G58_05560 [Arthrospira platensis FACHB-971]|uniref:hypothetical protein n=1 Tax=Limnospira TaxID=2596745 RepID=UPI000305D719|nr:hypothetical protein [Arthrospira platensis FACHB-971]MDT9294388.1 hypothetical protein [Arthrospira platensis PCC 7345]MDT9310008.1 hypothetical protein [Limnospira sp. Paracas R14]QQW27211.1 hypothetical protein AP9108_18105 [Arthrospira sp. PCC 9108]